MKKFISISFIVWAVLGVAGCQTVRQNASHSAVISASQWLEKSAMPQIDNKPMPAREIAYVLRKVGFEPSPSEVSKWIGRPRKELVHALLTGLKTVPVIERPS